MSSHLLWEREDDFLLKLGVEKGYSFLAMAKGAVRFSRKFTSDELKERWRTLLYDSVSSVQFAEWVVQSGAGNISSKGSKVLGDGEGSKKRKIDSVRKLFYVMRKKLRDENLDFGVTDCMNECCMVGEEFEFREDGVGDFCYEGMSEFEDVQNLAFPVKQLVKVESDQSFEHNYAHKDVPLWKTMEDVTPPAMPVDVSIGERREGPAETLVYPGDIEVGVDPPEPMLVEGCDGGEIGSATIINGGDLMDLPDSLLNFANEEEVPFIVEGGKDVMDETCHFLSSPMEVCEDAKRTDCENKVPTSHPQSDAPGDPCLSETADVADQSIPVQCNQDATISQEVCVQSSASVCDPCSSEVHDEILDCVLNTEEPEIPCNDDFNPCRAYVPLALRPANKDSASPSFSSAYEKGIDHTSNQGCPAKSTAPWRKGPNTLADSKLGNPRVDSGLKSEFVYGNSLVNLFTQANAVPAEKTSCTSNLETPISSKGEMQQEFSNAQNATQVTLYSESGLVNAFPELDAEPTMSDPEESLNDDEIPCFYDIEAMILDMDLCPENEYPDISHQVARYEDEATRRRIMRLEQCVQSATGRSIASQGAYGVFYGRHLKYYLKKTEVILGRSTEGHDVDIDLNREGRANKVSRRQALIKMEADGSFILKNLGRHEVYLCGEEITRGQSVRLASGSLIEVKEMAFIFEINHNCVRNYLAKIARISQESNGKFEWTPED